MKIIYSLVFLIFMTSCENEQDTNHSANNETINAMFTWDGYEIKAPSKLPKTFKKPVGKYSKSYNMTFGPDGFEFYDHKTSIIGAWLKDRLNKPVQFVGESEERYDFTIVYNLDNPQDALNSLQKLGFIISEKKSPVTH